MVTEVSGHSLPELLVALMFLAVSVVAVGAGAVQGSRWTAEAVARQEALGLAAAVLDSLSTAQAPVPGTFDSVGLHVTWSVDGTDPLWIRVEVRAGPGIRPVTLEGVHHPALIGVPDAGLP